MLLIPAEDHKLTGKVVYDDNKNLGKNLHDIGIKQQYLHCNQQRKFLQREGQQPCSDKSR